MKKQFITTLIIILSFAAVAQNNPDKKESKLELIINGKLGFAKFNQDGAITLNGNINGSDILLAYKISPKWEMASGIGLLVFNGNLTIAGNTGSITNNYLQIPIQFNGEYNLNRGEGSNNQNIFLTIGGGLYANTLFKQQIETVTGNTETKNLGWNFGIETQVGVKFIITNALNISLGLESQGDLTKMKKDGNEQRIQQLNALYFKLGLKF
jgi:hypothetical protein